MNRDHKSDDSAQWEAGCENDAMRNAFLIPSIAAIVECEKPATILDIGSATAYVPRKIQKELSYTPEWTLLDKNERRLRHGIELAPLNMICRIRSDDLITCSADIGKYDAVIASFTLLEIQDYEQAIEIIANLVIEGIVVIAVPDVWRDALESASSEETSRALLSGSVTMTKTDKFTQTHYPFHAVRTELMIAEFIHMGFSLVALELRQPENDVILMTFKRTKCRQQTASHE